MKPTQFAYWLKGGFEIGNFTEFNAEQTSDLKYYVQLVRTDYTDKLDGFCTWLQGFFDMAEPKTLSSKEIDIIRKKLYNSMDLLNNNTISFDSSFDNSVYPPGVQAKC